MGDILDLMGRIQEEHLITCNLITLQEEHLITCNVITLLISNFKLTLIVVYIKTYDLTCKTTTTRVSLNTYPVREVIKLPCNHVLLNCTVCTKLMIACT